MIAGADEMLGGGGSGAVIWVTLVACAVLAIIGVWMRSHALSERRAPLAGARLAPGIRR